MYIILLENMRMENFWVSYNNNIIVRGRIMNLTKGTGCDTGYILFVMN